MENGIKVFERQEFGQVRVVDVNGEPWFVASDVARALGYPESSIATISKLFGHVPDAWKGRNPIPTPNDAVNTHCKKVNDFRDSKMLPSATPMKIIPESDVYPARRKTSPFRAGI